LAFRCNTQYLPAYKPHVGNYPINASASQFATGGEPGKSRLYQVITNNVGRYGVDGIPFLPITYEGKIQHFQLGFELGTTTRIGTGTGNATFLNAEDVKGSELSFKHGGGGGGGDRDEGVE
jgi:hypothetical protein